MFQLSLNRHSIELKSNVNLSSIEKRFMLNRKTRVHETNIYAV